MPRKPTSRETHHGAGGIPSRPGNRFELAEWSGAVGDLGTMLPLAFALVVYNGFPPERLFLLWGLAYIATGWYYKVPVSIQPLKAMAVIAISLGLSPQHLATTSFLYGILLLALSMTGAIHWLQQWFTPALVKGIQAGVGLILAQKAFSMVLEKGFLLDSTMFPLYLNVLLLILSIALLWFFQFRKRFPIILVLLAAGLAAGAIYGLASEPMPMEGGAVHLTRPEMRFLGSACILLILPQLPLTLGNAVFAASDACRELWKKQAVRVNPTRLGISMGLGDAAIGLSGGFPVCHGAGGVGAHAQFGGKTGGTTIIIGGILVVLAILPRFSHFLFYVPVPILGAMLLFDSWRMVSLMRGLLSRFETIVASIVALLSFATNNISLAVIAGFAVENGYLYIRRRRALLRSVSSPPS